jgi:hypothetical protein
MMGHNGIFKMKLLFENWRQYLKEADGVIDHSLASHLQTISGAWGKFEKGANELIQNFQPENKEDFINKLWKLYKESGVTSMQLGDLTSEMMENWNLPDDIDGAVLDFAMEVTGTRKIVTFDFDDTLSLSHWSDEFDGYEYIGPHTPFIEKLKMHKLKGNTVYIVTSRYEEGESRAKATSYQRSVQEFVDEHGLSVDGIYFTNGKSKIETLLTLGSKIHHDDDPEDIADSKENGIEAIISDPYGDYAKLAQAEI